MVELNEQITSQALNAPIMQNFNRISILMTDASRIYCMLPQNPSLLPVFLNILRELFRLPRALSHAHAGKDIDEELIKKIDLKLANITEDAGKEWDNFLSASKSENEPYFIPMSFLNHLDIVYNEIYELLARKGLLMNIHTSREGEVAKVLDGRASA